MSDGLTDKQIGFCKWYVYYNNATKAYLEIYKDSNYGSARSSASTLLTNPNILEYIEELKKDLAKEAELSELMVLVELKKVMMSESDSIGVKDKIKAIEVINKMLGYNAPDKKEIKSDNTNTNKPQTLEELNKAIQALEDMDFDTFDDD